MVCDCFHWRKFRVTSTTPASGKSVTDYTKLRLFLPNLTVLCPQIRPDPLTAWTVLPPCCCGGDGWCWASDEPGLERKTKQCIPNNCCHGFILRCFVFHIGFTCIANTLSLTSCILKKVFQLGRAQQGRRVRGTEPCMDTACAAWLCLLHMWEGCTAALPGRQGRYLPSLGK